MAVRAPGAPSRVAGRIEKALDSILAGEPDVSLNMTAAELLAEPIPVSRVIAAALDGPGVNVSGHWRVQEAFRRSGLSQEIVNSLVHGNPLIRAAAARLCGALRLTESVPWMGELLVDPNPKVRHAAIGALAQLGGRRAVDLLMRSESTIPVSRLAIALSHGASDLDIEATMRQPKSEKAAVVAVLACGLRRDVLRVPPLLGIAHDRRWPSLVRVAGCKALGMIEDPSALAGLAQIARSDPDPAVMRAARRAERRLMRVTARVAR